MTEKYVVVTGASKGIGRSTALLLDQMGFHVFAGVRKAADGETLCGEASERMMPLLLDVTDAAQIAAAAEHVRQTVGQGGLAGLVNNAGVAVAAPLEFLPLDDLRRQLEINVIGQVAVTQAMLPFIRLARGRIINISSIGGRIAGPMIGAYHASKFALEAINDTLRMELLPWGIEVVAVEPGAIATPIWDTSMAAADEIEKRLPPQAFEYYQAGMDGARANARKSAKDGAPPEKVAEAVAHALTATRPQTRYLVGTDAKIVANIILRLPTRLRDRLMLARG